MFKRTVDIDRYFFNISSFLRKSGKIILTILVNHSKEKLSISTLLNLVTKGVVK